MTTRFALALLLAAPPAIAATPDTLFVDPESTTARAALQLEGEDRDRAERLARIPSASWFTDGTPAAVETAVKALVDRAAAAGQVPVLVAYNLPFRDCALYSAGGAADASAYDAWLRGFARGIGDRPAIVILEPDGLGVIPWNRTLEGSPEACQPAGLDGTASQRRFETMVRAVDVLAAQPGVRVYLDATTSNWLSPAEAAGRLVRASVDRTAGFFLNVSNYEGDERTIAYARWVSDCIALVTHRGLNPRQCPSPRWAERGTRARTDAAYDRLFEAAQFRRRPAMQKRAVIDTSRSGMGSWVPPEGRFTDAEVWCNPPGRGLGRRPTLATSEPYVDAFLWVKVPGESDGECFRGTDGPIDPAREVPSPRAGAWFPEQVRELIERADPPLP